MDNPGGGKHSGMGLGDLSEAEKHFVELAGTGRTVDLGGGSVRGAVIRAVVCEVFHGGVVPPVGLRIVNAVIEGGLQFEGAVVARPLIIENATVQATADGAAVTLSDVRAKRLVFETVTFEGGIVAERARIENGLSLKGGDVGGAVTLQAADVGGGLELVDAEIGDGGRALVADGLRLQGALDLRSSKLRGLVSLARAQVALGLRGDNVAVACGGAELAFDVCGGRFGGDVQLDSAKLDGVLGVAHAEIDGRFVLDGAEILSGRALGIDGRGMNVSHGLSAQYCIVRGTVDLKSAHIAKGIRSAGFEIAGGDVSLAADVVVVGGNWDLSGAKLVGDMQIPGSRIAGQLRLTEARVYGSEVALRADGARIEGGCFMSRSIVIGVLRFPAAFVGNQFRLRGASLKVDAGPALLASSGTFARDVELGGGMTSAGGLVFDQAELRGTLNLTDSQLVSAYLSREREAAVASEGADGQQNGYDDVALSVVDARINRLVMPEKGADRPRGIVSFSRAHVGTFEDFAAAWPPASKQRERALDGRDVDHYVLDGFRYDHLGNPSGAMRAPGEHSHSDDKVARPRLRWLSSQEACDIRDHFKPQPWIQLGERLAAQGYHDDARKISIARQRLSLASHSTGAGQRWQGRILDLFALFGHNPWRTVLWMVFFVVLFAGVWAGAAGSCRQSGCFDETVYVISNRDAYTNVEGEASRSYPAFHSLAYSFDVFVPFIPFGYADHWRPNMEWAPLGEVRVPLPWFESVRYESGVPEPVPASRTGDGPGDTHMVIRITGGSLLYLLGVLEALLGLTLTSLAITGFTGLLRSD